jgi:RNase P subunit RPR2
MKTEEFDLSKRRLSDEGSERDYLNNQMMIGYFMMISKMKYGFCKDCGKFKYLTKHSIIGNHQPPFIRICRRCHNIRDGIREPKKKINKKYVRGTKRIHKRKCG